MFKVTLARIMFPALFLFTVKSAVADTSPTFPPADKTCGEGTAKMAKVKVTVQRLYWLQEQGDYISKMDEVCSVSSTAPVIEGSPGNCTYKNLATCPITLDGKQYKIVASGSVLIDNGSPTPTKTFNAWYHVDRNSGSVKTGEASSAQVSTEDLNLTKLSLSVQSKFDGFISGKVSRDGIIVKIDYEGNDAP